MQESLRGGEEGMQIKTYKNALVNKEIKQFMHFAIKYVA